MSRKDISSLKRNALITGGVFLLVLGGVHLFAGGSRRSASKTISTAEENLGSFIANNGKNVSDLKASVASLQRIGFFRVRAHFLASLAYKTAKQPADCDPTTGDPGKQSACWMRRGCFHEAKSIYDLTILGANRTYIAELMERISEKHDIKCRWNGPLNRLE